MKKIFTKKILYTLCFVALNVLDFVRNTQNGDIWSVAANATGVVMLVIVASQYPIRELLTPVNYVWSGLCAAAIAAAFVSGHNRILNVYIWAFVMAVISVWWIVIFGKHLVIRFRREKSLQRKTDLTGWLWIAMSVLMTFSRSGRVWPVWFLAMFGIFYMTRFRIEDRDALMDGMVDGTILSFFLLQIFAYGFRPYDVVRYLGAFNNSNITALHYLVIYVMVLFKLHLLHQRGAKKGWKLFYFIGACGLLGFMVLPMGRTAWVMAFLITVLYGIWVIRRIWKKTLAGLLCRFLALGMTAIILFPVVFGTVRWLPTILHHPIWFLDEYSIDKVHSFDPPDSWKYIELDEFLETLLGRVWGTFQASSIQNPFVLVVRAQEDINRTVELVGPEGMDPSLNIRLSIFKAYLEDLNLLGHTQYEGHYQIEGYDYMSWHAQNVWLQAAYYYGIPAGVLFLLLTVLLLRKHYRGMKAHPDNAYGIIPLFICLLFFGYGLMEIVWNIGQLILFLFFFVQHPQIYGEAEKS